MSEPGQAASPSHVHSVPPPRGSKHVLHRVCIQCNNMFRVTPENFDSKQCSNCRKD